jgi:hypothetical protein
MMTSSDQIKTSQFQMTNDTHALLAGWLKGHLMNENDLHDLPKLGLMVSHCNTPVGVAFLRQLEGGDKAMVEGFLTNPDVDVVIRTQCLDQLILDLVELARRHDVTGLFALTVNKRVIARAKRLGFSLMKHKLVSLNFLGGKRGQN